MNILVTGGSRGIGRAICIEMAGPGRRILINYLRNKEAAEETARLVEERGAEALIVQGNVRSEDDLKAIAAAMETVDVLVHNAAIGSLRPFDRMRTAHWDLTLESSLRPFWLLTKIGQFGRRCICDWSFFIGIASFHSWICGHGRCQGWNGSVDPSACGGTRPSENSSQYSLRRTH